jgi:hypothetical protein
MSDGLDLMLTVAVESSPLNFIGTLLLPAKVDFPTLVSHDQISALEG